MTSAPPNPQGPDDLTGLLDQNLPQLINTQPMLPQLPVLNEILPMNQQNLQNDAALNQPEIPPPQQDGLLPNLLMQLAFSNPTLVLKLLGYNDHEGGALTHIQDVPVGMPNAPRLQAQEVPSGLLNWSSEHVNGVPDFTGVNLLHFFDNGAQISEQSSPGSSSSSSSTPRRRRHHRRATCELAPFENAEPPTDVVPDDEWQQKVVEYCSQSQLYTTWKHGIIGLDCLINPYSNKKFPQLVLSPPASMRNLYTLVRNLEGRWVGAHKDWDTMPLEQRMEYDSDLKLLRAEIQLQIQKGWISPVKRPAPDRSYKRRVGC